MIIAKVTWNLRACRGSESLVVTGTTFNARSNVLCVWVKVRGCLGLGFSVGDRGVSRAAVGQSVAKLQRCLPNVCIYASSLGRWGGKKGRTESESTSVVLPLQ